MNRYAKCYYKYLEEGHEDKIAFNALVYTIADIGTISDLRALCDARKKATAATVTYKKIDNKN